MVKYTLQFFDSPIPFVVTLKRSTCKRAIYRDNTTRIVAMAGFIQHYYLDYLTDPVSKKNMLISVFLTRLNALFLRDREYDCQEDELWLFLGDGRYERKKPEAKDLS